MERYGSWEVESGRAFRTMPDGNNLSLDLRENGSTISYEGWWPKEPKQSFKNVITGLCLWDARWQMEFKPRQKGSLGAKRSLALPRDREDAYERLIKGNEASKIYVPIWPGGYHELLIKWQAEKLAELDPEKIYYHLPSQEYKYYIDKLEHLLNKDLSVLENKLNDFVDKIEGLIGCFFKEMFRCVEFISPIDIDKSITPEESFLWPYLYPERLGACRYDTCGVEDLVEIRLAYEAWSRAGFYTPVLCGILQMPNPYLDKTLKDGEVDVVKII